jgi:hypothetical protein
MTWSEQHQHARHWVFRELDRLMEERSRTERKEPLHGKERDLPRLARLRALLIGLLRQARRPRARKRNPNHERSSST